MKILLLEWKSFGNEDIKEAFTKLNCSFKTVPFSKKELHHDEKLEQQLISKITSYHPDFVFSFNYFPIIASVCKETNVPYVSWIYDSPYVLLYSYTVIYPTNRIFVFDKNLYEEFHRAKIPTVHYLPLAANTDRLSSMTDFSSFRKTKWYNRNSVSFIGSLYTEKHQFYQRLKGITPYTEGYLEGIMTAQKQVYGYNFIKELLTPDIIEDLMRVLPMQPDSDSVATLEYLYSQYVINRQITATERTELLEKIGKVHPVDLYTPNPETNIEGCCNHGPVDYYDMAPYVFKNSKINLNFTLRSIESGIPLRAFDILGAGGFLLTNFQADFTDCYTPDEDFVYFEDADDLLNKIDYYLTHEKERKEISENGFQKTKNFHTYEKRIQEMISCL